MLFSAVVDAVPDAAMAAQLERLGVRVVLKPFALELRFGVPAEVLANRTTMDQQRFLPTRLHAVEADDRDASRDR